MSDYSELVKALRCENCLECERMLSCPYYCDDEQMLFHCDVIKMTHDAADAIGELQAEVAELKKVNMELFEDLPKYGEQIPRWISVEERLPEKVGSYLTAYYDGYVCENQWHYTGITAIGWINDSEAVRYWMPLPSAPEEEE